MDALRRLRSVVELTDGTGVLVAILVVGIVCFLFGLSIGLLF